MMKRFYRIFSIISLVLFGLLFVGCNESTKTPEKTPFVETDYVENLKLTTIFWPFFRYDILIPKNIKKLQNIRYIITSDSKIGLASFCKQNYLDRYRAKKVE